jgi:5-deoxy-glucuronate isomerase
VTDPAGRLYFPAGDLATDEWALDIEPENAGWEHTGLRILELSPGRSHRFDTGADEVLVLPLSGSCSVSCEATGARETFELAGRRDVFAAVSDFAYVPRDAEVTISSTGGGRFALPTARASSQLPARYGPAEKVAVEFRGAGNCSRQIVNFCTPDEFEADSIIAVEVYTPGGNWSSYPPHKHDEQRPDEAELEEIYYYIVADGPAGPGIAYQRVSGTNDRPIDVLAEVRTGDVVLIPHGWHGPSIAAPGYDLYYLNVMAGPGPRAWLISIHPEHAWVRDTWADQPVDPRLPMTSAHGEMR